MTHPTPSYFIDELDWNEAIGGLRKYSLVKRDPEKKILNIHRLVQVVIRDGMKEEEERVWVEHVVRTVAKVYPIGNESVAWAACQKYLPHAQMCIELIERRHMKSIEVAQLLNNTCSYLCERGKYSEAEPLLQQALLLREQLLGQEDASVADALIREQKLGLSHPDVATTLEKYAFLLYKTNR